MKSFSNILRSFYFCNCTHEMLILITWFVVEFKIGTNVNHYTTVFLMSVVGLSLFPCCCTLGESLIISQMNKVISCACSLYSNPQIIVDIWKFNKTFLSMQTMRISDILSINQLVEVHGSRSMVRGPIQSIYLVLMA